MPRAWENVSIPFGSERRSFIKMGISHECKPVIEPLFGERDTVERHLGKGLPSGGLGPPVAIRTLPSPSKFGGLESKLVKAMQRPCSPTEGANNDKGQIRMAVSVYGQWRGLRGEGSRVRTTGSFRYPLFGDAEYSGQLVDGKRHGKGRQVSHRGVYTGEFKDGEIHGRGKRQYVDGCAYDGEWKAGLKHGVGELFLANGDKYNGDFVKGKMHGWGTYEMTNGDTYDGEFVQGCMTGSGTYYYAGGRAVYRGDFVMNQMTGKGTLECVEDQEMGISFTYTGDFVDGKMHGAGFMHMSGGDTYEGYFECGLFEGEGVYTYSDGSRYHGGWRHGKMEGFGTYQSSHLERDVETYTGMWVRGKRHGKGVAEVVDTAAKRVERQEGTWVNGQREGRILRDYSWGVSTYEEYEGGKRVAWSVAHGPGKMSG